MGTATSLAKRGLDHASATTIARETAASGLAAALAGLIVGGVGGRLAMRASAMLNPIRHGTRSDNGNIIGQFTAEGSIELLIFGGLLFGVVVAGVWVAVRTWLPGGRRLAMATLVAAAVIGPRLVNTSNFDFFILGPAWIHVVMFTALVGAAGWLTAWFDRVFVDRWSDSDLFTVAAVPILGLGALTAVAGFGLFFSREFCDCRHPPRWTGTFILIALIATATTWVLRARGLAWPPWLSMVGKGAVVGAVVTGLADLAWQINVIV